MNAANLPAARLWIDADACPVVMRAIINKAARRTGVETIYVANQPIPVPRDSHISARQVASGFDVADDAIAADVNAGDLVISGDIPLVAEVMAKGAAALSPRGEWYDAETIGQRLNMRDFMDTLRSTGVHTGGPPPLGPKEKQAFANHLDRWLQRRRR